MNLSVKKSLFLSWKCYQYLPPFCIGSEDNTPTNPKILIEFCFIKLWIKLTLLLLGGYRKVVNSFQL